MRFIYATFSINLITLGLFIFSYCYYLGGSWNWGFGYTTTPPPLPIWPYPALFATFMVKSPALMFIVVLLMSLWWFGWSGTLFLARPG